LGDITNLLGAVLAGLLPTIIILGIYVSSLAYIIMQFNLIFQVYDMRHHIVVSNLLFSLEETPYRHIAILRRSGNRSSVEGYPYRRRSHTFEISCLAILSRSYFRSNSWFDGMVDNSKRGRQKSSAFSYRQRKVVDYSGPWVVKRFAFRSYAQLIHFL